VVKFYVKAIQVFGSLGSDAFDEFERGDAFALCFKHDGCAMRIVSANKMYCMAAHAHRANPDIRLDVFHDVANVKRSIGIRQSSSNEECARHELFVFQVKANKK